MKILNLFVFDAEIEVMDVGAASITETPVLKPEPFYPITVL